MSQPRLIVCMGVSGSGKTTLARQLARQLGWQFLEADDFHPQENRDRMASGLPLSDAHRAPWMAAICDELRARATAGSDTVLAHSALRHAHRQQLRGCGLATHVLHLCGPKDLIGQRMAHRAGHFMPGTLLDSQYEALQDPTGEPDVITLDVTQSRDRILRQALEALAPVINEEVPA